MKDSDIHISVIIPLYNKERAIVRTLESVAKQTVVPDEIIVVDDGSTDNSLSIVKEYVEQSQIFNVRFQIIEQLNAGVSAARNTGIRASHSEHVALLDADDLWDKEYLAEQVRMISDFPDAAMWGVGTAFIKEGKCWKWQQGMGEGFRGYVENYFGTTHNDLFCSSSVLIRKNVFKHVGYFDERISSSEDLDMWYRIILKYPVAFYDNVLVYYNQDAENRVAYDTKTRFPLTKDIKFYIDKHNEEFDNNPVFSRFMNNYVAMNLLKDGYYFGTAQERKDSDVLVRKLRYQDIHPKYRWIFQTPRWFGRIVYEIVCLKKELVN